MQSKAVFPECKNWNELEGKLKEQGISVRYKYCGSTDRKQGVLFSKNGFEFSGSKIDRAFNFTKLDNRFNHIQQQTQHRATLFGEPLGGGRQLPFGICRVVRQHGQKWRQ
ncbi:MAG: hypothetical protein ACLSHL_06205 [Alistipes communis]